MLKHRLITALILISLVITALFLLPPAGVTIITLILCIVAALEWGKLAGLNSGYQRTGFALLCGLMIILLSIPACQDLWLLKVHGPLWLAIIWWTGALLLVISYPKSATLWRHSRVLRIIFGILTIIPFSWGISVLHRYGDEQNHFMGAWGLLYVMSLVWSADSGAYMAGKLFGKHKLAPAISPGKTWEGLIGGLCASALICWLFYHYTPITAISDKLFIYSIITFVASVFGDLTESMFKREAGIKDSGNCIPGHGGVLDRIDSLTAAIPVFACLIVWM